MALLIMEVAAIFRRVALSFGSTFSPSSSRSSVAFSAAIRYPWAMTVG
jgi:hypothetical protein